MKKRILSFLLAFLTVVSIFPAQAFATDNANVTITPSEGVTEPPCITCGKYDCTSSHLTWCTECKKDDCGVVHTAIVDAQSCPTCSVKGCTNTHERWCATCGVDNCTNHTWCDICKTYTCTTDHGFAVSEGGPACNCPEGHDTTMGHVATCPLYTCLVCGKTDCYDNNCQQPAPTHPMVGKYVKLAASTMFGYVADPNWSYVIVGSYPAFMEISEVLEKDGVTYYRLKAAPNNSWPTAGGYSDDTVYQEAAKLVVVTWCDACKEYDCGEDHSQPPVEPENPCDCCDSCTGAEGCECACGNCDFCEKEEEPENPCDCCDSCTGAEGCECACGNCDFCEKAEDPDVPSISATINGQTVTVSGEALPEGAELVVRAVEIEETTMEEMGLNVDYLWDIKVYDAGGNEWQPEKGETLEVSWYVGGSDLYANIFHFLSNPTVISDLINSGMPVDVFEIADESAYTSVFKKEISAYREATASEDTSIAIEVIPDVEIVNGMVTFEISSFSVFTSLSHNSGGSYTNEGSRILLVDWSGSTYYVTAGETVYFDTGPGVLGPLKKNWSVSGNASELDFYYLTRARTRTTVNSGASEGDKITVTYWGNKTDNRGSVTLIVVKVYTLTYNANGGTVTASTGNSNGTATGGTVTQYVITGETVSLPKPTREGYIFGGWVCSNGSTYSANQTFTVPANGSNLTFTAQWTPITYTIKFDPNTANAGGGTVTGSMTNIGMTYDVETTLPRCKYVNSGDGMVFLGWATSPTGDVVHKDGAKIKNLTTTNGDTVTLYAKWKYGLDSTIYVGINNTYHNPKGTYTAGGVTINSYHTYPNEPAQMIGDFDRVTDDKGAWRYDSASAVPLKYKAENYIRGNVFNSPDYEMTYVQGENTLGIADPTGSAVRSMLKFAEADYNAMIAVWLEGMRNTLISYGDTSFDWQNAKASDFTIVPYVIKFQNYDSWYIDMVVVPKALYTLAYDGNIENGYTATFTGVAFPPSSQYTDGSTVNVVTTPIGYQNNNMKVTKVIDGHTWTATFQYWYDNKGNTYGGNTGRNTIKLTADTILYAKWEYPDARYGNLNITKTVVDKDVYEDPSATQTFTFKFTTSSAGGPFSYTIYDQSANVKNSGTIANNSTFTLQDGWRIRILDMDKDASYFVTETAVNYYTNVSGTVSGTINAGATIYATVTNEYQKNADYTVKHFLQNADKNGYTEQTESAEKCHGTIGTDTEAEAKTYNGYMSQAVTQKKIQADGKTVIEIYYDLMNSVDLTITATTDDVNQNFIFTVSGTRSDGVEFKPIEVVLCNDNNFQVTIKDLPVGIYAVTENNDWSWRENAVESKTADLRTTSQTVSFDFYVVDDLHWLSGYSYNKRKKGGS